MNPEVRPDVAVAMAASPTWEDFERRTGVDRRWLLQAIPERHRACAWVAGSMVECLGTPSSDVDVFVAVDDFDGIRALRSGPGHCIDVLVHQGRRHDFEYWSREGIEQAIAALRSLPLDDPDANLCDALSEEHVQLLTRLHVSLCLGDAAALARWRNAAPLERLRDYLVRHRICYVDDALDDAQGFIGNGDGASACLRIREAAGFAVDVWLQAHGPVGLRPKYRLALLGRLAGQGSRAASVLDTYWHIMSRLPDTAAEQGRFVERAFDFCESLIRDVQP